jgi:hypothetical protein
MRDFRITSPRHQKSFKSSEEVAGAPVSFPEDLTWTFKKQKNQQLSGEES